MGLGLKKRLRVLAERSLDLVIISKQEQSFWPERDYVQRLFAMLDVDCVFDVGANRGQYGKWLRTIGFEGLIVSYEPQASAFATLRQNADPNWLCFPYALGAKDGQQVFNIMADDVFSSFRAPAGLLDYAEENRVERRIEIEVRRLDSAIKEIRRSFTRPFLKMDTQGFDLEVLKGAGDAVRQFQALVSEVAIKQLYEGAPAFQDSVAAIRNDGFEPAGMFSVHPYKTLNLIEMNAYFVRRDLMSVDLL